MASIVLSKCLSEIQESGNAVMVDAKGIYNAGISFEESVFKMINPPAQDERITVETFETIENVLDYCQQIRKISVLDLKSDKLTVVYENIPVYRF